MMSHSEGAHSRDKTPGRGSGMAGVGLRSEQEFDKDEKRSKPEQDSADRAKRNLAKDMQVDGCADRPAKEKPVETTPLVSKKKENRR